MRTTRRYFDVCNRENPSHAVCAYSHEFVDAKGPFKLALWDDRMYEKDAKRRFEDFCDQHEIYTLLQYFLDHVDIAGHWDISLEDFYHHFIEPEVNMTIGDALSYGWDKEMLKSSTLVFRHAHFHGGLINLYNYALPNKRLLTEAESCDVYERYLKYRDKSIEYAICGGYASRKYLYSDVPNDESI